MCVSVIGYLYNVTDFVGRGDRRLRKPRSEESRKKYKLAHEWKGKNTSE